MEVILMFYQSGGVINRYRIFSINFPSPFQFRPQAFSRFSYFLGEKLWRHDCSPPPTPLGMVFITNVAWLVWIYSLPGLAFY